ncbi:MAG: hypothetical protein EXX96DRAFT_568657 [Benjaminiella poitrasii]|nr:MAG: hypothetical protein EXX96DRAFT_568657 [Benjaminiella poitrasii]
MVQTIEVFLQPPSPTMNGTCKLPPVKELLPLDDDLHHIQQQHHLQQQQSLPSIRLTTTTDDTLVINNTSQQHQIEMGGSSPNTKLDTIEPNLNSLSISTSPYQQPSPLMSFSSPSSTTSSINGSPLISPIQDGPFLLPPPDAGSFRRCRSVSNVSNTSSPATSPFPSFTFRSLSEPPTFDLPPPNIHDNDETTKDNNTATTMQDYHPIFGPKRKRGRPPNATRPEIQSDSNWTFVKPTVWDVKHNNNKQQQPLTKSQPNTPSSQRRIEADNKEQQNQSTTTTVMSNSSLNTFTTTNMDIALSIPKKKRGRKPKKQLAGNSCFVWRDLTAPRGANKKSLLSTPKNMEVKK